MTFETCSSYIYQTIRHILYKARQQTSLNDLCPQIYDLKMFDFCAPRIIFGRMWPWPALAPGEAICHEDGGPLSNILEGGGSRFETRPLPAGTAEPVSNHSLCLARASKDSTRYQAYTETNFEPQRRELCMLRFIFHLPLYWSAHSTTDLISLTPHIIAFLLFWEIG